MNWKSTFTLAALAAATPCIGADVDVYGEPYALVESGMRSPVRKEFPAIVHAVDGQITFSPRRYPTPVKPGKHMVDVYFSTNVGPQEKQYRSVELDAAPCTRYRIVAHYTNLTHVEWTPVIYPEPIGECTAKFGSPKS